MTPADGGAAGGVVEMARRIARVAEMSAGIMRDRRRTGGWAGAEKTAQAFDRLSRDAYALHNALTLRTEVDATGGVVLEPYDAGLLGDGGGGDVDWWQDYIRAELERAHEFYRDQVEGDR